MEKSSSDFQDYWNELSALQERNSTSNVAEDNGQGRLQTATPLPSTTFEGEDEAEWLKDAGLGHLTDTFRQGKEIAESDVNASVRLMPKHQIDAVKRRVKFLNQTLKNKYRQQRTRHKKPDIRDVFKDVEVIKISFLIYY